MTEVLGHARASTRARTGTRARAAALTAACLAVSLLVSSALAFGGGGGSSPPPDPAPDASPPTSSEFRSAVSSGSSTDGYYDTYACSRVSLGTYTDARGLATTSSSPYKSSYMSHNVRLYVNGTLVARSPDVTVRVSGASATNYVTSITPARVSHRLSCPQAFVATIEARGWHKAISIHGHSTTIYTSDTYYG